MCQVISCATLPQEQRIRTWIAQQNSLIATLSCGFADGYAPSSGQEALTRFQHEYAATPAEMVAETACNYSG